MMSEHVVDDQAVEKKGVLAWFDNLARAMEEGETDAVWTQLQKLTSQLKDVEERLARLERS